MLKKIMEFLFASATFGVIFFMWYITLIAVFAWLFCKNVVYTN